MFKTFIALICLCASLNAFAVCRNGQMTNLTKAVEFVHKEGANTLKVALSEGSEVHIINIDSTKIELLASTMFKGQPISLLGEVGADGGGKALSCSSN